MLEINSGLIIFQKVRYCIFIAFLGLYEQIDIRKRSPGDYFDISNFTLPYQLMHGFNPQVAIIVS